MLCVSLGAAEADESLELLKELDAETTMVEVRVDLLSKENIKKNKGSQLVRAAKDAGILSIATCRSLDETNPNDFSDARLGALLDCVSNGASYVDVEYEAPTVYVEKVVKRAKQHGVQVVVSFHDYETTPSMSDLEEIVAKCYAMGADVAKVAVMNSSAQDAARVLALYASSEPESKKRPRNERKLVALGMGAHGKITRFACLALGSPFTFCAASDESATAPGQLSLKTMLELQRSLAQ